MTGPLFPNSMRHHASGLRTDRLISFLVSLTRFHWQNACFNVSPINSFIRPNLTIAQSGTSAGCSYESTRSHHDFRGPVWWAYSVAKYSFRSRMGKCCTLWKAARLNRTFKYLRQNGS